MFLIDKDVLIEDLKHDVWNDDADRDATFEAIESQPYVESGFISEWKECYVDKLYCYDEVGEPVYTSSKKYVCGNCGKKLYSTANFCSNCGSRNYYNG